MHAAGIIMLIVCALAAPLAQSQPQTQESYPAPVSEYAEKTGPNTMTFLAYPKYYRAEDGALELVNTNLVASKSGEWDYEVAAGIWQLYVRADGTFQARHEGDIFTYRFAGLGVGRGADYKPLELGKLNWENIGVVGDSVRWSEVLPNVDVTVRYIHDILKVDVRLKSAFMRQLREQVKTGILPSDEYLTARFDIPSVQITTQAKQNGEAADVYGEKLPLDQPLHFERDGKELHKLLPVKTFLADEAGMPLDKTAPVIRSAQSWRLKRDAAGEAEMSAHLGDLAAAKDGDAVIDPSMTFGPDQGMKDTLLRYQSSTNYGSVDLVQWQPNDLLLFGFGVSTLPSGVSIKSAKLNIFKANNTLQGSNIKAKTYKVKTNWNEYYEVWETNWGVTDANYSDPKYQGKSVSIIGGYNWLSLDVTFAFKSHFSGSSGSYDVTNKGFTVKMTGATSGYVEIAMRERTQDPNYRPQLVINYGFCEFGADAGPYGDGSSQRQLSMKNDNLHTIRFFDDGGLYDSDGSLLENFVNTVATNGMKVITVFGAWPYYYDNGNYDITKKTQYAQRLVTVFSRNGVKNRVQDGTIIGIELGNEEANGIWIGMSPDTYYNGSSIGGERYASFYLEAYTQMESNLNYSEWKYCDILASGSSNASYSLAWPSTDWGSNAIFLQSFVNTVITNGGWDRLPNVIAIHNYSLDSYTYSSEFHENTSDPNTQRTEWFDRLSQLHSVCNGIGYIPNFAMTEYGYSPRTGYDLAPLNTDDRAQAIYYLRSSLISATMKIPNGSSWMKGIGWKYHFYYHHCQDYWPSELEDYGFFNENNQSRVIRIPAELLHRSLTTGGIKLGWENSRIWTPANRVKPTAVSPEGYAWCGWQENASDIWWGAIWKYKHSNSFEDISETSKNFITKGNFSNRTVDVYKFDFTLNNGVWSATWNYKTTINPPPGGFSYNSSTDETTIPVTNVDENPTFILID
ncbi:MAG: hypothetical protein AB1656_25830 [Candidatus Omnitrophota bacterium]